MMNAPIILLKEGTDQSQGRGQIMSNVNACTAVVDIVKTTLGPRGMDKLIHNNGHVTITNDGATVMQLLNVVHPAARILVDIAKAQDDEIGDGTTSVVVLAGEILKEAKNFVEEGMHPLVICKCFRVACQLCLDHLKTLQVDLGKSKDERRQLLQRCAETSLCSKLVSGQKEFFGKMVVDAVMLLDEELDKSLIGIKKVSGGGLQDSFLVSGVAFKKSFSYAGFEQQPKKFTKPLILLLNLELELKAEKENAEIRISSPEDYQRIVNAEWTIIYEKLDAIVNSGAKVVLSRLPIGDLATQYFADRQIFCAGRVDEGDLKRTAQATGGQVQTTVHKLSPTVLGTCAEFEEQQIGEERYNLFNDCPKSKSATIILRGGASQFLDEAERSLNDALMIVRRAFKTNAVVGGGGAIEMELSRHLREHAKTIADKQQLVMFYFARALEAIPMALATNSGLDATDILNKLRQKHNDGKPENRWVGVDCINGGICNTFDNYIWEPAVVKQNAISAATEAACLILSVDETIRNPKSQQDETNASRALRGAPTGRGRGMRR
eukprot:Selendium_serpulae@DN4046_c0_g1_i1.p1